MLGLRWNQIALVGALLALLVLVFEIVPRFGEAAALAEEWWALEARLAEAEGAQAERVWLEAESEALEQDLGRLLVSLPRRDQLSAVLGELQRHAAATGVTIHRIQPAEPVSQRTHELLPIRVEARGAFHDVGRFIDRIERSPLLMRVRDLALTSEGRLVLADVDLDAVVLGSGDEARRTEARP